MVDLQVLSKNGSNTILPENAIESLQIHRCGNRNPSGFSRRDFLRAAAAGAGLTALGLLPARAQEEDRNLPASAAGPLTIMYRTLFERLQTLFHQALEDFAAEHDVTLDASTFSPATGDFIGKMQAAVAAGNPPDLAYISSFTSVSQLHLLDLIEDVTNVVDTLENQYGPTMLGSSPHKNAQFDGVWNAIPYTTECSAWFVRAGKLEDTGINPVTDLNSYDQRRDAALAMSDANNDFWGWGLTPNRGGDGYSFLIQVINAFGGHYTDSTGTIVEFDSPETLAAVEWLTELYIRDMYAPMLPPGILSWTDTSNNEAYLAGAIGMTANAFSLYAQAKRDENPVFADTVVLRSPMTLDGRRQDSSVNNWLIIPNGAANLELAKDLALYLVDPVQFTPMATVGGGLFMPAYEDLWTDDLLAVDPNFTAIRDIASNPAPYMGHSWPAEPSATIDAIRAASIPETMMANIIADRMSPPEAVANAHHQITDILEEGGIL